MPYSYLPVYSIPCCLSVIFRFFDACFLSVYEEISAPHCHQVVLHAPFAAHDVRQSTPRRIEPKSMNLNVKMGCALCNGNGNQCIRNASALDSRDFRPSPHTVSKVVRYPGADCLAQHRFFPTGCRFSWPKISDDAKARAMETLVIPFSIRRPILVLTNNASSSRPVLVTIQLEINLAVTSDALVEFIVSTDLGIVARLHPLALSSLKLSFTTKKLRQ